LIRAPHTSDTLTSLTTVVADGPLQPERMNLWPKAASASFNGAEVGQLELGPPRDGEGYRQHHLEVLESAARSVAQALYRRAA